MADLRACVESLGFRDVRTIIQSGTVVFSAGRARSTSIESKLESALLSEFALRTTVAVRSSDEIERIIAENPFRDMAERDPAHVMAVILKRSVEAAAVRALQNAIVGREEVAAGDGVLYVTYPDGSGESKLTAAVIDRALGTIGTARNWNTMQRVVRSFREEAV